LPSSKPVLALSAAIATCACGAAPAFGASATVAGDTVVVTGDATKDSLYVDFTNAVDKVRIADTEGKALTPGAGCTQGTQSSPSDTSSVLCSRAGVVKVRVNAGDGDDLVYTSSVYGSFTFLPVEYFGEGGRDDLRGGGLNDLLDGGPGNDKQLLGDLGNDTINGGDGDDERLTGDTGLSNQEAGTLGSDTVSGGTGVDTLVEERNIDRKHFFSLDGVANDGVDRDDNAANGAEEGDNAMPDIENVTTGFDDDTIIGSAANNKLQAGTLGIDVVNGGDGDDDIFTGVSGEQDSADGGNGNDKVAGNGTLKGGPGNDAILGQGGNDQIDAGPGVDTVDAGGGNDVVNAVDGEVDQIGCGIGADIANVDTNDVVNADPGSLCETLTKSAPPAGGGGGGTQDPTGNPNATAVKLLLGTAKLTAAGPRITVTLPAAGSVTVTVTVPATTARAAAKSVVVASGKASSKKAGKVTAKLKWTKKAKKKLRRSKKLKATVKTTFRPAGSDDKPTTITRKVTLKR
jgi:Ca2+-binding RTX toxin-like protein